MIDVTEVDQARTHAARAKLGSAMLAIGKWHLLIAAGSEELRRCVRRASR